MQPFQWRLLWIIRREKREILSTSSSAITCYSLALPGQAVDQNLLEGFWQTDRTFHKSSWLHWEAEALIRIPQLGLTDSPLLPPPPCPTHLPPSRVFTADLCEGHACNSNLPEDEMLHRERAGTTRPEQFRNIIKAWFSCNRNFSNDQEAMTNLLYFCLSLHDTRLILYRSQ